MIIVADINVIGLLNHREFVLMVGGLLVNMKIGAVGDVDIEEGMPRRAHIRHYDHYNSGHSGGY